MDFGWLQSLLYGFLSGLTEILPVSAQAHKAILVKLFGQGAAGAFLELCVHLAVAAALYWNCRTQIGQMQRQLRLMQIPRHRRKRQPDMQKVLDMRVMKTAVVPMALAFFAYSYLGTWRSNLGIIAGVMVINGLILYIPQFLRSGNKDSRSMSALDSVAIGIFGALGIVPGISRVGAMTSCASARGADKNQSLNWALMLSIPVMLLFCCFDLYAMFTAGLDGFTAMTLLRCILAAAACFGGTTVGVIAMRAMASGEGWASLGYYCWGGALFTLILYLTA